MSLTKKVLLNAYKIMATARAMSDLFEEKRDITSKYVHATSRGHEAAQIALGMHLLPKDYLSLYYRDDSVLLTIGMSPYELMLQLLAKKDDPFSGGRTYYSHPSLKDPDKPKIPHQSSATGMQAIPITGCAMGLHYKEVTGILTDEERGAIAVCSIGDAAMTEGEVSEALQMAVLKKLPILYFVQDNGWDISANAAETRAQNAFEYAQGFKGLERITADGSKFDEIYAAVEHAVYIVRNERRPVLLHTDVPLLGHHTSGVRREMYRDDLHLHQQRDPLPYLRNFLMASGITEQEIADIDSKANRIVRESFEMALRAEEPNPEDLHKHYYAPTPITKEEGERTPAGKERVVMVDSALYAVRELLAKHPEALLYGQDVGRRLGGVFREAATLAQQFGDERVFNTPIQEAFIIGSTVGMSAVGLKPIVEVQFADYIWPGLNQLFTELSRSYFLSNGKWPVSAVIRVPIGAYGSGGPYHSSSVESVLANIRGIKVVYPSTGADLKGLLKSAFYDPNPVVVLEHKGLYWSKVKGTEDAKTVEPDEHYVIPIGQGRMVNTVEPTIDAPTCVVVTYGMGVYWSKEAAKAFPGQVEILDLRSIVPVDFELIRERVQLHGRCLIVTEEAVNNSFAQALAGRVSEKCFEYLDAPVQVVGSIETPAIPLNSELEAYVLPNANKVRAALEKLLKY
ncbi:MAG: thiamine pyrophosphate-dependent enzyme [Thermaurantimonas sp.]